MPQPVTFHHDRTGIAVVQQIQQRKSRDFQPFNTVGDVINVLRSQFTTRKLFMKYSVFKTEVTINEYLEDNSVMLVTDPDLQADTNIIIYGLSDKYLEVDFEIIDIRGPGYYHCKIRTARRATHGRRDLRFKLAPDEVVATNFKVSKQSIDLSNFNIPTSIKVVLEQFQSQNSKMSDIVKVDVFSSDERESVQGIIQRTGKSLWIADTSDPESYRALNDDFLDLHEIYADLQKVIKRNQEKSYKSILVVPILYITENSTTIPFAYIRMISKSRLFTIDDVLDLKNHSFKLVDRIRDANTNLISIHQQIVDISRGGAKIKITDQRLKQYIPKSKGFIFDIVFRLQAPITIYGEIKMSYTDDQGNLFVGVDFEGNSSRKNEMKRFFSVLKPMEVDYKNRLMKTMKTRKTRNEGPAS